MSIERKVRAFEGMHKNVAFRTTKKRQQAIESHNRKKNVRKVNFTDGDFVLRGVLQKTSSRKPALKWTGPYRVVECKSDYVVVVQSRRLRLFRL